VLAFSLIWSCRSSRSRRLRLKKEKRYYTPLSSIGLVSNPREMFYRLVRPAKGSKRDCIPRSLIELLFKFRDIVDRLASLLRGIKRCYAPMSLI